MILFSFCGLSGQDLNNFILFLTLIVLFLTFIVLIANAIALFQSLYSQKYEANFRIIYHEINDLKNSVERYQYNGCKAEEAVEEFVSSIALGVEAGKIKDEFP